MGASARSAAPETGVILRKQFVSDVSAEGGDRELAFTISTGSIDRHNDTIKPSGWQLDNFRKGGVVLWAHQQTDLPIARATYAAVKGGALKARAVFATRELYPFADTVYQMLKEGCLKSTSVGSMPLKWVYDEKRGGYDFEEAELLEFSVVPVPANPDALLEAKDAGINLAPLTEWAERTLDAASGPGIWVPRRLLEQTLSRASGSPVSVSFPSPETVAGEQGSAGSHAPVSPGASPGPATIEKAGRTLSAANEARVKSARDAAQVIASALDEVLSTAAHPEEDPEDKPSKILRLRPSPAPPEPSLTKDQVAGIVVEAVNAVIRRARGRLD